MARGQAKSDVRQQPSLPRKQGKHPQAIRKSARLQEIQQRQRGQVTSKKKIKKGIKKLFPSPSTSNTLSKEVPRRSPVPLRAITPPKRSSPDPGPKEVEADPQLNRKRKQGPESLKDQDEPSKKRARISVEGSTINPIDYWIKEGSWPKELFEPGILNMNQLSRKHSFPTVSYAQSVKQGDNPPAYTPGHENVLARAGIFMDENLNPTAISSTSKELCVALLQDKHKPPDYSLFEGTSFWMVVNRVRSRNERRIERDIMSSVIPSAELLYIRGGALHLEHLTEELSAEWTRCVPLGGPRPTPDFAVGFMSSAFTPIEVEKLKFHTTPERATQFTEMLYFPFLLCEVKRSEAGLNIADRQNIHSASMAVNAIIQLCRAVPKAEDLHQKILVFSISHDHATVKIYGHYPLINGGDRPTFHRHLIDSFDITVSEGKDRWKAYKFVRQVYDVFVPIHLERIQRAIAQLPDPITESIVSSVTAETEQVLAGSHEVAGSYGISGSHNMTTKMLPPSVPSSQNTGLFKKPRLQPKAILQQEINSQKQQFDDLQEQLAREREQGRREREENKQRQDREMEQGKREREENQQRLDREREESQQRLDREREESKQRHTELMQLLKQMDRQIDELKREKDDLKQEKDDLKREKDDQREQVKELTDLLKQQLSGSRLL